MIKLPSCYQKSLSDLKFIDLFAGIGGFRLAWESFGAKCVFSSEINKYSCLTYEKNFGVNPYSDIRQVKLAEIPQHDILCVGFPCQAFSISENVPNLLTHDKEKTFNFLVENLAKLNYQVEYQILDANDYQLPQSRRRLFILGFQKDNFLFPVKYSFPQALPAEKTVKDILEIGADKPSIKGTISKGGQGERIYSIDAPAITLSAFSG
ncbi:10995_t:CDS:2, partial [Entrophospora sp. SA101]